MVLFVNVASYCGLTKTNYKELNELYTKYREQGLAIIGFPCNQFLNQEPACEVDIKEFAKKNNVEWDLMSKVDVNGNGAAPIWKFLKSKLSSGILLLGTSGIKWNFTKFLCNRQGLPVKRYEPTTAPSVSFNHYANRPSCLALYFLIFRRSKRMLRSFSTIRPFNHSLLFHSIQRTVTRILFRTTSCHEQRVCLSLQEKV